MGTVGGRPGAVRLGAVVVATLALALVACGDGDGGDLLADVGSGAPQGYGGRAWRDARLGDGPDQVVVGFTGPDPAGGEGCQESYEPETYVADDGVVRIALKVPHPMADASCPTTRVEVTVDVEGAGGLAEGDVIESGYSGYRYRLAGQDFALMPETTPCGRVDCSTPSPVPSPCTTEAYRAALERGIDANIFLQGEPRCDGSFLVTGIDVGSGGCPPVENEPSPCARVKTAYFVARDGGWGVVTYGEGLTCADVAASTEIRFPDALCA
jgi:hypothetical protein